MKGEAFHLENSRSRFWFVLWLWAWGFGWWKYCTLVLELPLIRAFVLETAAIRLGPVLVLV